MPLGNLCLTGCCGGLVGFMHAGLGIGYKRVADHAVNIGYETILDLEHTPNFNRIVDCRVIFAGLDTACGAVFGITTFANLYPQIKEFLNKGGRLWIQLEWGHPDHPFSCFIDTGIGDFLSAMGTTMNWLGGDYQPVTGDWSPMVPGTAKISQGLPSNQQNNRFAEISPGLGKVVWKAGSLYPIGVGKCVVAGEKIGNGFIFMTGDSDLWDGSFVDGEKELVRRLIESDDSDLL
jgi:hypothetical protein